MRHDPAIIHEARVLRQVSLPIETLLWQELRDRRFRGLKFRRQAVVAGRVVAFLCASQRLVILAAGGKHGDTPISGMLERLQWSVMVLDDADMADRLDAVLRRLAAVMDP